MISRNLAAAAVIFVLAQVSLVLPADAAQLRATMRTEASISPIRRVVNMLMMMSKKVEAEGEKSDELYEKFMCYCKTSKGNFIKAIETANDRIPQLESSIEQESASLNQLESELLAHRQDREAASKAVKEASAMRSKDAATYATESAEQKANIAAMGKAIAALEAGMGKGDFLQTDAASRIQGFLVTAPPRTAYAREELTNFFQQGVGTEDSGEILGILKQMKEDFEKDLETMVQQENDAISSFQDLDNAKSKEIAAATTAIEDKEGRLGDVKVQVVELKHDLEDTQVSLARAEKLVAGLTKECNERSETNDVIKKERAAELMAISDTIKMLNDDDAQDLFKKTAGGAAMFLQMRSRSTMRSPISDAESYAMDSLKQTAVQHSGSQLGLLAARAASAARSRAPGAFAKVNAMIDNMVGILKGEQKDDDLMRDNCRAAIPKNNDKKDAIEKSMQAKSADIENSEDQVNTQKSEIAELEGRIRDLDASVEQATLQRKSENAASVENLAANNAALELLELAVNRLNNFYNDKLYKEAPKAVVTESERISGSFGVAFLQEQADESDEFGFRIAQTAPTAGKEAGGVVNLINMIRSDIKTEIATDTADEKNAQREYEDMLEASKTRRQSLAEEITEKESVRADLQENLKDAKDRRMELQDEHGDTVRIIANLHQECDFLLQSYDARKEARGNEIDSLQQAKAVLAGAK